MEKQQSIDVAARFGNLAKSGVAASFFERNYTEMKYTVVGYEFLKDMYNRAGHSLQTDYYFRYIFGLFYAMNPFFVTKNFMDAFYRKMDEIRGMDSVEDLDAVEIAAELYEKTSDDNAKRKSFQFSFVTKMLNLADDTKYPIYDSKVALVLKLGSLPQELDGKKKAYGEWYDTIKKTYDALLRNEAVRKIIALFKETFDCAGMSDLRALDIIVWEMGKNQEKIDDVLAEKMTKGNKIRKLASMGFSRTEILQQKFVDPVYVYDIFRAEFKE